MSQQHEPLTEREMMILTLIAGGLSNHDISKRLSLGVSTVKWHVLHIYQKLHVKSRTQAVAAARELDILRQEGEAVRTNGTELPARLTPLIGREQELRAISELLEDRDNRLVTIVGPGGVGKTRLALAVARQQAHQITGQVFFVSLEGLASTDQVAGAIGGALGLSFGGDADLAAQVLAALRRRKLLVVLDNIEHLLPDAALLIGRILEACPLLTVLGTSRERLNLRAEVVFTLEGLAYPTGKDGVEGNPAIRLFVQVASRSHYGYAPREPAEVEAIARFCRLVEGMPLAIEIAAGWVELLPVDQISAEISRSLQSLTAQARDVPDRHRSMEAVCAHSWQLLTDMEQTAFMRLAVFRGGFDRAAAEAVAGASLFTLSTLVDKSLVRRVGPDRYKLHELLRQFAEKRLQEDMAGYVDNQERHSRHYGDVMQGHERTIRDSGWLSAAAVMQMIADYDNIMAGWEYAIQAPMRDQIGRYVYSMGFLYNARGMYRSAAHMFSQALEQVDAVPEQRNHQQRMCLLMFLGWYLTTISDFERGAAYLEEALSLIEDRPDDTVHSQDSSQILMSWGWNALERGETARAKESITRGLVLGRESQYHLCTWTALCWLGMIAFEEGEIEAALESFKEAQAIAEGRQDVAGVLHALPVVACAQAMGGDMRAAIETLRTLLEMESGLVMITSVFLSALGLSILQSRLDGPVQAFETLTIILRHPQCAGPERRMAQSLWNDLRAELPAAQADEIIARAERGAMVGAILEADFIVDRDLLNYLSQVLDGYSRRVQQGREFDKPGRSVPGTTPPLR